MNNYPNNDNPIVTFFKVIDEGSKWIHEQIENFIVDYPQTSKELVKAGCNISSVFITEVVKPMVIQYIKNTSALNEQNKTYYSSLKYIIPFPMGSMEKTLFDIYSNNYSKST